MPRPFTQRQQARQTADVLNQSSVIREILINMAFYEFIYAI
jgi:hypothetical protein